MLSYRRDTDFVYKTAKSISMNIPSSKFAFSPKTLDDIFQLLYWSALTQENLFLLASTKLILQNGFHHDYVRDLRRKFSALELGAMATADTKDMKHRIKNQMGDDIEEALKGLEVLGEEAVDRTTEAEVA